jgi:hypothetical protein
MCSAEAAAFLQSWLTVFHYAHKVLGMAYTRWVLKGTLVDAYGKALPPVLQAAYGSVVGRSLYGITLFSNGHVMQLLEGEVAALQVAVRNLQDQSKIFGIERLLQEPTDGPSTESVSVGLHRFKDEIAKHLPGHVQVFSLCADEICQRTSPGKARDLLLGFA